MSKLAELIKDEQSNVLLTNDEQAEYVTRSHMKKLPDEKIVKKLPQNRKK